jgi:hypothetical protein
MAEASKVNLSRALKLKNRVVHRLAQLDNLITSYNSMPDDNQEYDVRALYKDRLVLAEKLVQLKVAISAANQPIQHLIFELAECKSLVGVLKNVNARHGLVVEGYAGVRVNYIAQFRKPDLDREIRRVEQEIDRIQDELDRFNHETLISVDKALISDEEPQPNVTY